MESGITAVGGIALKTFETEICMDKAINIGSVQSKKLIDRTEVEFSFGLNIIVDVIEIAQICIQEKWFPGEGK
ncbi:hypothetical protein D3C81_2033040 [compost metagenome]